MGEDDPANNEGTEAPKRSANTQTAQVIGSINTTKPATEEQLNKVEREMNAFERSTLKWTRATFGVYALTALLIACQWKVMNSQLVQIQRQADLMRDQMEVTSGATIHLMRPPFSYDPQGNRMFVSFLNQSSRTAKNGHTVLAISLVGIPNQNSLSETRKREISLPDLYASTPNNPNAMESTFQWTVVPTPTTKQEAQMIASGEAALRVEMQLSYDNGFRTVDEKICYAYLGFNIVLRKTPQSTEPAGSYDTPVCDQLPNAIKSIEEQLRDARRKQQDYQKQPN